MSTLPEPQNSSNIQALRESCDRITEFIGSAVESAQAVHKVEQALWELVARMPERLGQVIVARYGLGGGERQTLAQIGLQLGVCGERVRQLQQEALVWLRHPAHSQEIRSLLARHTRQQYELAEQLAAGWRKRRHGC